MMTRALTRSGPAASPQKKRARSLALPFALWGLALLALLPFTESFRSLALTQEFLSLPPDQCNADCGARTVTMNDAGEFKIGEDDKDDKFTYAVNQGKCLAGCQVIKKGWLYSDSCASLSAKKNSGSGEYKKVARKWTRRFGTFNGAQLCCLERQCKTEFKPPAEGCDTVCGAKIYETNIHGVDPRALFKVTAANDHCLSGCKVVKRTEEYISGHWRKKYLAFGEKTWVEGYPRETTPSCSKVHGKNSQRQARNNAADLCCEEKKCQSVWAKPVPVGRRGA